MARLWNLSQSRLLRSVVAGVIVVAAVVIGLDVTGGPSTYRINAVYASAPGLFPGAAVDVLGVPVGTVTSVTNVADRVEVGMQLDRGTRIPTVADASLVAPELLGQPDVDLNPGYTRGAYLRPGETIAESHTSVPVSTDQLLKQLQKTLKELNPGAVGNLITNLSQDLDGQGAGLNKLIGSAAGTLQLLADKGADLGQLNGTLAQLTGTLDSDTSQIEQLVREYDTVSSVVAQHSGQLNDAITQLAGATTSLATLLTPNLAPLEADVGTVTTVGRTLDRNISNVDEILQQANNLFQGAQRVFDPTYNWLNLNLVLPPGVTGDYVVGLIRDRLAGVCRRLVANHSAGLTAATLASLNSCGNPNSTFFDPLFNDVPGILSTLSGSDSSSAGTALLQQGLDQIGSIGATSGASSGTAKNQPTTVTPGNPAGTPPSSSTPSSTAPTTTTTTVPTSPLCGLLGTVLGCPAGTTSPGSSSSSSSSGLSGLLSQHVQSTKKQQATVRLASTTPSGPSLTAPAARAFPPFPRPTATAGGRIRASSSAGPMISGAGCERTTPRHDGRRRPPGRGGTGRLRGTGASRQRSATAVFSDVGDLSKGAQVQLAEVPIGSVTSITLDGDRAKVTMQLSRNVRIPANVTAALDQTTILGDQFIDIEVPKNETGEAGSQVPQLQNGGTITHTTIVPDVEQLVQAGAQVFGSISTTELEQIIAAGGEGFTGQEASLKSFLSDLSSVTAAYAQHTSQFTTAIDGLNQLSATLAPSSSATGTALTTLSKTVAILAQQSSQFETLLQSIDNLSTQGRQILETYYPQIVTQLKTLQAVSGQLSQNQGDLAGILQELPANNSALPSSVRAGYLQLYENIIVCGLPDGGEDDSSPAFSCAAHAASGK